MHPILIDLPFNLFGRPAAIHAYGFLVAVGFMTGVYVAMRGAARSGMDPDRILSLSFWLLISGLMGGRVLFIIVNIRDYLDEPYGFLKIWEGGLVWYGAVAGGAIAGIIYMRIRKMPFWRTSDILMPGIALGHAIGRLACFMAGCCWGTPCSRLYPLGVTFINGEALAPKNIPLHPVQLYEAAGEVLIFVILTITARKKRFDGQLVLIYAMLYPILRSVTEFFRGDTERGYLVRGVLSTSQFISIIVFLGSLVMLVALLKRNRVTPKGSDKPAQGNALGK